MTDVACINKSWKREGSDVEAEAEAVGSGLFQRKRKQKGSFQIFASSGSITSIWAERDYFEN